MVLIDACGRGPGGVPAMVRLYVKPWCGWCVAARKWLARRGIPFEEIDVTSDRALLREMHELSGQGRAPIAVIDGEVLADFGPDDLERFLRGRGYRWSDDDSDPRG